MRRLPFLLLLLCSSVYGQNNFIGIWEGKLPIRDTLSIVFHISKDSAGKLNATMDSPDQGAFGIKADSIIQEADSIKILMKALGGYYAGILSGDSAIKGFLKQGMRVPLTLIKVAKATVKSKPQTPQPPFPYAVEEVTYFNKDKSFQLAGTITRPNSVAATDKFPAILLITGSGAQNRDEEIMGHKPFFVLADFLTRKGFVVLRVDDRGTGASTGTFKDATTADFLQDVESSVDFLKNYTHTDAKRIGLIGHSEGGLLAFMAAAKNKEINFIITLAGPGMPIVNLMQEQNIALLKLNGMSDSASGAYGELYKPLAKAVINAADTASMRLQCREVMDNWLNKQPAYLVKELGIQETFKQNILLKQFAKEASGVWYKYFLAIDPAPYISQLSCKVLALNGEKDFQVVAKPNLDGIKAALKKSKSPAYDVIMLPGMNHLFQTCNKCTAIEYGKLEETFSPDALSEIDKWLKKNVPASK